MNVNLTNKPENKAEQSDDEFEQSLDLVHSLSNTPWVDDTHSLKDISGAIYNLFIHSQNSTKEKEDPFSQELAEKALDEFVSKINYKDVDTFISWMAHDEKMNAQDRGYMECLAKLKRKISVNAYLNYGANNTAQVLVFLPVFGSQSFIEDALMANFSSLEEYLERGILADFNKQSEIVSITMVPALLNPESNRHLDKVTEMNALVSDVLDERIQDMNKVMDTIKEVYGNHVLWDLTEAPSWDFDSSVKDSLYSGLVPIWVSFKNAGSATIQKLLSASTYRNIDYLHNWQNETKLWFNEVGLKVPHSEDANMMINKPWITSSASFVALASEIGTRFLKVCELENNLNFPDIYLTMFELDDNKTEIVLSSNVLGLEYNQLKPVGNTSCVSMIVEQIDIIDAGLLHENMQHFFKNNNFNRRLIGNLFNKKTYLPPRLPIVEMLPDPVEVKRVTEEKNRQKKSNIKNKFH
jgi:hypothetical protein